MKWGNIITQKSYYDNTPYVCNFDAKSTTINLKSVRHILCKMKNKGIRIIVYIEVLVQNMEYRINGSGKWKSCVHNFIY